MKLFFFLALICFSSFADDTLEHKLQTYIQDFNLSTVTAPSAPNKELYILGRNLFFSVALSGNNNISCAHCHHPAVMGHDALPLALGEGAKGREMGNLRRMQNTGKILARNSPALFNLHNIDLMFWDGRIEFNPQTKSFKTPVQLPDDVVKTLKSALAAQAIFPLVDHAEMRGQPRSNPIADAKNAIEAWDLLVKKILSRPIYKDGFDKAFPGEKINIGHVGEAIAEFERQSFYFADTPYDRYLKGDKQALSLKQKQGMDVFFNKGRCGECHKGEHLSSFEFKSIAVPQIGPGIANGDDLGRYQWEQKEQNQYAFRVPPLRNIALTAPYMHNGAFKTLLEVVEHYDDVRQSLESYKFIQNMVNYLEPIKGHDHAKNDQRISLTSPGLTLELHFTEEEEEALLEFLEIGLTDIKLRR